MDTNFASSSNFIIQISLANNFLASLPISFGDNFLSLTILNLSMNLMDSFPPGFGLVSSVKWVNFVLGANLTSDVYIDLSHNLIDNLNFSLPKKTAVLDLVSNFRSLVQTSFYSEIITFLHLIPLLAPIYSCNKLT